MDTTITHLQEMEASFRFCPWRGSFLNLIATFFFVMILMAFRSAFGRRVISLARVHLKPLTMQNVLHNPNYFSTITYLETKLNCKISNLNLRFFGGSHNPALNQHLLQLPTLMHTHNYITAADKLALNEHLRDSRPVPKTFKTYT